MLKSFYEETRRRSKLMQFPQALFQSSCSQICFGIWNFRGFLTGDTVYIHHIFCKKAGTTHRSLEQYIIIKHLVFLQWNQQIHEIKTQQFNTSFMKKTNLCQTYKKIFLVFRAFWMLTLLIRNYGPKEQYPLLNHCVCKVLLGALLSCADLLVGFWWTQNNSKSLLQVLTEHVLYTLSALKFLYHKLSF